MRRIRKPLDQVSPHQRQRRLQEERRIHSSQKHSASLNPTEHYKAPASSLRNIKLAKTHCTTYANSAPVCTSPTLSQNNSQEQRDRRIHIRGDFRGDGKMASETASHSVPDDYLDDSLSDCDIKEETQDTGGSAQMPGHYGSCYVQGNISGSLHPPPNGGASTFLNMETRDFHNNIHQSRGPPCQAPTVSHTNPCTRNHHMENLIRAMEERIEARATERHRQVLERLQRLDDSIRRIDGDDRPGGRSNLFERPSGFPLVTIEEFYEFEQAPPQRHQDLRQYLIFVGGHTLREALNQFVKETVGDQLIREFSWWGKKTGPSSAPRALFNSKLAQTFYEAVCRCKNFGRPSRAEYVMHMKEVVRSAKQRGRNIKLREQKTVGVSHHDLAMQLFPDPGEGTGEASDSSSSETR